MSNQSDQFHLDIPNFGKVPVQLRPGSGENDPATITHAQSPDKTRPTEPTGTNKPTEPTNKNRPTDSTVSIRPMESSEPFVRYISPDVKRVNDPTSNVPKYAVLGHKLVTLTLNQFDQLREKHPTKKRLRVGLATKKGEQEEFIEPPSLTINLFDCDCEEAKENDEQIVLLIWDHKKVLLPELFPDVLLFDPITKKSIPSHTYEQTNNFVLSGDDGGPHNPPPHPPWANEGVSALNVHSTDFKLATPEDIQHYEQFNGQDRRPAVAVLDTGLKFKIHDSLGDPDIDKPYVYRDADGTERQFNLAYHDPSQAACDAVLANNPLGFCAIQAYREPGQPAFESAQNYSDEPVDIDIIKNIVKNSPYDDCQIFEATDEKVLQDARHGSTVTALIQQNGDNAPVVPVKAFDNVGMTTLFDVLNGLNYIFCQRKSAAIRVVNASWICRWDEPLIRNKIKQLMEVGIFVIAAAGNEKQTTNPNLDIAPAYPACYSEIFPNVIAVTSVRKTYIPHKLVSRQGDSIISGLLTSAIRNFGLFGLLETGDDVVSAILPTAGYVAVENYSTTFVNVGVVSTFGYFRSPFWTGKPIRGSSFACALVSAFVISQLSTRPDLLPSKNAFSEDDIRNARQELLMAMSGVDDNLQEDYVNGGYYLAGYEVD